MVAFLSSVTCLLFAILPRSPVNKKTSPFKHEKVYEIFGDRLTKVGFEHSEQPN